MFTASTGPTVVFDENLATDLNLYTPLPPNSTRNCIPICGKETNMMTFDVTVSGAPPDTTFKLCAKYEDS